MEPSSWPYQHYANQIVASQANQLTSNFHTNLTAHHVFGNVNANPHAAHSGSGLGKDGNQGVGQGPGLGGGHGSIGGPGFPGPASGFHSPGSIQAGQLLNPQVRPLSPWQSVIPFSSVHTLVDQDGVRKTTAEIQAAIAAAASVEQKKLEEQQRRLSEERRMADERRMAEERRQAEERRLIEERRQQAAERERRDREEREREQRRVNSERARLEQQQQRLAAAAAAAEQQRRLLVEQKLQQQQQQQQQSRQRQMDPPQHHQRIIEQKRFAPSPQQQSYGSPLSQPVFPTNVPVYAETVYNSSSSKAFHLAQQPQSSPMTGSPSSRPGSGSGSNAISNTNGQMSSPCAFENQAYTIQQQQQAQQQSMPFNFSTNQISHQGSTESYFQQAHQGNVNASNFPSNAQYYHVIAKNDDRGESSSSPRAAVIEDLSNLNTLQLLRSPSPPQNQTVLINLDSKTPPKKKSAGRRSVGGNNYVTLQSATQQQVDAVEQSYGEDAAPAFANIFMNPYDPNFQPVVQFSSTGIPMVFAPHHNTTSPGMASSEQSASANLQQQFQQKEEPAPAQANSKVVTPDAESTLGFLASGGAKKPGSGLLGGAAGSSAAGHSQPNGITGEVKPPTCPQPPPPAPAAAKANTGFMDSFMKFLKGEKDEPEPPPKVVKKPYIPPPTMPRPPPPPHSPPAATPGVAGPRLPGPRPPAPAAVSTPGMTPKMRISFAGGSPRVSTVTPRNPTPVGAPRGRGRGSSTPSRGAASVAAPRGGGSTGRGRGGGTGKPRGRKRKRDSDDDDIIITEEYIPKRETSRRQAKDKAKRHYKEDADDDGEEEILDSDSDPAWTPSKKKPGVVAGGSDSEDEGIFTSKTKVLKDARSRQRSFEPPASPLSPRAEGAEKFDSKSSDGKEDPSSPFKLGAFIVRKTDLEMKEGFPIWKIDSRTALQKFESFVDAQGDRLYKKHTAMQPWSASMKANFEPLEYEILPNRGKEVLVRIAPLLSVEMHDKDFSASFLNSAKYLESFEVYVQSLISQALDTNFLSEIIRDNDVYFTDKIEEIDSECRRRKDAVCGTCSWSAQFRESVNSWPCINAVACDKTPPQTGFSCDACGRNVAAGTSPKILLQLFGQRYDAVTVRNLPPAENLPKKDYEVCMSCKTLAGLYSKVVHLKYDLYAQCASRVTAIRTSNPQMESTDILNTLLADEKWVQKLFNDVQRNWARLDVTSKALASSTNASSAS